MSPVHPKLTEELVRQLLDEGENAGLDYKAMLNVRDTAELVQVTKDIGAMQTLADGGFLVVGANDDGSLSGGVEPAHAEALDEARFRGKLLKYLPEPLHIVTRSLEIDEQLVVVIHVARHPAGFAVFKCDGSYKKANGKDTCAFRAGDIYTRRNTSSQRCQQADWEAIIEEVVGRRKEEWRRELRADLAQLDLGAEAQRIARGPAAALTWQLDSDAFIATAVELLRANDRIPLNLLLDRLSRDAPALVADSQRMDELNTLLDRTAALAALGLNLGDEALFERAHAVLVSIYNLGFDQRGYARSDLGLQAPALWLLIIERVIALGGLAVRKSAWPAVRQLAVQKGRGEDFNYYNNWIRHTVTMAARAGLMDRTEGGTRREVSLIASALELARRETSLLPDVAPDDEALLDSLCQFDVLAAMAAFDEASSSDGAHYYPNFCRFNWGRSEPSVVALIDNPVVRKTIFPRPDAELAAAISDLARMAHKEGFRYMVDDGWESKPVTEFLKRAAD
jgi:hypothetical protein